jgi:hypothetical protein
MTSHEIKNQTKGEHVALWSTAMKNNGAVHQSRWMWKLGIPPVPLWLVGWFVIPLERFRHNLLKKR